MKKILAMTAVLGIVMGTSTARAQSSVTLYGIADGNVRFDHTNVGTLRSLGSGGDLNDRWGIRGSEDLGNGMKANFIFEQGFDIGDNSVSQGNVGAGASAGFGGTSTAPHSSTGSRLFSRIATVSLSGGFGEIKFGRYYNPAYLVQTQADPFGGSMVGMSSNIYVNNTVREDNAVYYDSPTFAGLRFSASYQLGESTTDSTTTQAKRGNDRWSASMSYVNGPLTLAAGTEQIRSNLNTYLTRVFDAAATYDFGVVKLHAIYWHTGNDNPLTNTAAACAASGIACQLHLRDSAYTFGATVPFGAWTFLGQAGRLVDQSHYNNGLAYGAPRATYLSTGFRYNFTKRTNLYAAYAHLNLKKGAQGQGYAGYGAGFLDASNTGLYNAGNLLDAVGRPNVNPWSAQFGIRHLF